MKCEISGKICDTNCPTRYEAGNMGEIIENLEAISKTLEQEPKTGCWILTIEDWNKWTCSECGFTKRTDIHVKLGYNFCPKCGTKMTGNEG